MTRNLGHPIRYTSWPLRAMDATAMVVLALLPLGITADTPVEPLGWVALVAGLVLAGRAARMGVWISANGCTVRNLFRTRRFGLDEVDRFDIGVNPFAGPANQSVVLITRSTGALAITVLTLPVFGFLQSPGRARCAAMNAELDRRRAAA